MSSETKCEHRFIRCDAWKDNAGNTFGIAVCRDCDATLSRPVKAVDGKITIDKNSYLKGYNGK